MRRLGLFRQTCTLIITLLSWLDENFERLFEDMTIEYSDAPQTWIGNQIVEQAFVGAFS